MKYKAFLSYSHVKDLDGSVSDFHKSVEAELNQIISCKIFMDKVRLGAGDLWNEKIKKELEASSLLLILLSPSWLESEFCKKEYQYFSELKSQNEGKRNVIPILWKVTSKEDATDERSLSIFEELSKIQYVDWSDLKYNRDYQKSTELRKAVGDLADAIKQNLKI